MKTQNRPKISALLITYNEILHIREVLENLSFADEIIVVDSFSTDGTVEVIKEFKEVKLVQRPFNGFADQMNYAMSLATCPWIIFPDADERLPELLVKEILETIQNPKALVVYYIKRDFYFNGKKLKYGGFQYDKLHKLFQTNAVTFKRNQIVHQKLNFRGKSGTLKHSLIHFAYKDFEHYKQKRTHYAQMRAEELYSKKVKPTLFHLYVKPIFKFFQHYLWRFGCLGGKDIFKLNLMNARSIFDRYVFLKELYKNARRNTEGDTDSPTRRNHSLPDRYHLGNRL
ncbi:MAG: glycosyltransferase family 2 protein [Flavobacteriaceae bacterium]|nr:glycosyltransferase family 2 protein [Flavobacteriaceae bacterium]